MEKKSTTKCSSEQVLSPKEHTLLRIFRSDRTVHRGGSVVTAMFASQAKRSRDSRVSLF